MFSRVFGRVSPGRELPRRLVRRSSGSDDQPACKDLVECEKGKQVCPPKCDKDDCSKVSKSAKTSYEPPKNVRLTVLGAVDPVAQIMCLHLKMNQLIKEMRLHDNRGTLGLAMDLRHVNTTCRITNFSGESQLAGALRRSDVVVLVGGEPLKCGVPTADIFEKNAEWVCRMSEACLKICPDAIFAILVEPINSTVPLFSQMFRQSGVFCPNRVLGSMANTVIRSKTVAAKLLGFDPQTIKRLDVIGGNTPETMVPVMTSIQPCGEYLLDDVDDVVLRIRSLEEKVSAVKNGRPPSLTSGYFASKFVNSIVAGFCGVAECPMSAFVRSNVMPGVSYMSSPVEVDVSGVKRNLGIPLLSHTEVGLFEESIPTLLEDIHQGELYAKEQMAEEEETDPCDQHHEEEINDEITCPKTASCKYN